MRPIIKTVVGRAWDAKVQEREEFVPVLADAFVDIRQAMLKRASEMASWGRCHQV